MRLTFLVDNAPHPKNHALINEHGFSVLIEFEGKRIVCDTGKSDIYKDNAEKLNIDLQTANFVFLSHGHNDHTGGIGYMLQHTKADIYLSDAITDRLFYSLRHKAKRDISTDHSYYHTFPERFVFINRNKWLDKNIAAIYTDCKDFATPKGNQFLTVCKDNTEQKDDFSHELSLVFITEKGLVIVSPCSHSGVANIITSCLRFTGEKEVYCFIGGLHFVDSDQTENEVAQFIKEIQMVAPKTLFLTGHCTSDKAKKLLEATSSIHFFYTGMTSDI